MGLEHEYERMINDIQNLRNLSFEGEKGINLKLILTVEDASWVSRRIYEEIDRGIFSARFEIRHSEHSVELGITLLLVTAGSTAVITITKRTCNRLFDDLEDYLDRKKRMTRKKKNKKLKE